MQLDDDDETDDDLDDICASCNGCYYDKRGPKVDWVQCVIGGCMTHALLIRTFVTTV